MILRHIAAAALALASLGACAQSMKPGLWEITNQVQGAAGGQMAQAQAQMAEQMKNMPPEQRKMVEEMMAKNGVRMGPGAAPGGMALQVCISKEMAERNEMPVTKGDCKTTTQRSGSTMKVAFTCSNPPSSGEGEVSFSGSDAYRSRMRVNTAVAGKPETINVESAGKWLAADCGSLKPRPSKQP